MAVEQRVSVAAALLVIVVAAEWSVQVHVDGHYLALTAVSLVEQTVQAEQTLVSSESVSVVAAVVEHSLEPAASVVVHQPPSVASAVSPVDFYVEQATAQ